jgi:hypothetical protein
LPFVFAAVGAWLLIPGRRRPPPEDQEPATRPEDEEPHDPFAEPDDPFARRP